MSRAKKDTPPRFPEFRDAFLELMGDMTLDQFSKKLEMSRATVGFYAAGQRIPDALGLKKIAEKCNVSADWLLGISKARSRNASVTQICNATGLLEDIVNVFYEGGVASETFNELFGRSTSLMLFIMKIRALSVSISKINFILSNGIEKWSDDIREARNYMRYCRFEAVDYISSIINGSYKCDEIDKRVDEMVMEWIEDYVAENDAE